MKNTIITSIVIAALTIISCKDTEKQHPQVDQTKQTATTSVKPLLAKAEIEPKPSEKVYYVTASSGLSLRAGSNLNSKKVLTLPYGAQVQFISSPAHTDMKVGGVEGKMLEIAYQGAQGFAFDGYLSSLAPPQTDEDIEDYAKRISTEEVTVKVTKVANKKGENHGMTTTIELPAKSWNEMYKVSQRLFSLPKNIQPDFQGKLSEKIIVNKNKRERTFKDELAVNVSADGNLESLVYSYKLRDYTRAVTLTKTSNGYQAIEVEESL